MGPTPILILWTPLPAQALSGVFTQSLWGLSVSLVVLCVLWERGIKEEAFNAGRCAFSSFLLTGSRVGF